MKEAGLGLTYIRRDAFEAIAKVSPKQKSTLTGRVISNPFMPFIGDTTMDYYGDDRAFFYRAAILDHIYSLIDFTVDHDGIPVKLADVQGLFGND